MASCRDQAFNLPVPFDTNPRAHREVNAEPPSLDNRAPEPDVLGVLTA